MFSYPFLQWRFLSLRYRRNLPFQMLQPKQELLQMPVLKVFACGSGVRHRAGENVARLEQKIKPRGTGKLLKSAQGNHLPQRWRNPVGL